MAVVERPKITFTGIPLQPELTAITRPYWYSQWQLRREDLLTGSQLGLLDPNDRDKLLAAERASRDYYRKKVAGFRLDPDYLDQISVAYYQDSPKTIETSKEEDGIFLVGENMAFIRLYPSLPDYIFRAALAVHHELGHGAGPTEVILRQYKKRDGQIALQFQPRAGFQRFVRNRLLGQYIEEGLVALDQFDFYKEYLEAAFPREFSDEQQAEIDKAHKILNDKFYTPIPKEVTIAFARRTHPRESGEEAEVVVDQVRQYRITQGLCRIIGFHGLNALGRPLGTTDEELIQLGRNLLEFGRFVDNKYGIRLINEAIGEDIARHITHLRAWETDDQSIHRVMLIISGIEKRLNLPIRYE